MIHTAQLRPVVIPDQEFKVRSESGRLLTVIDATTADRAMRLAYALFGDGVYLTRAEPAPHRELHPAVNKARLHATSNGRTVRR